jgi:flagellar motor switch protein FliG
MGIQKAAMLLLSMDTGSATELLKGLPPEDIQQIAMELAKLDSSGHRDSDEEMKIAREFCDSIRKKQTRGLNIKSFLNEMLVKLLGKDKAEQIKSQIRKATEKKDSFAAIRSATTDELVLTMEGKHPQTISVILSELPMKKSQEVLSLLSEETQSKVVRKMTNPGMLGARVRQRIASTIGERLKTFEGETLSKRPEKREQNLRKLALLLGGLDRELRDQLLGDIKTYNEETSTLIRNLMVTWEDIPSIADRSLQEMLRTAEPSKLALALYEADENAVKKIRSNISERAAAALDEEISLMQEPMEDEVFNAREEILIPLRQANKEGKLRITKRT